MANPIGDVRTLSFGTTFDSIDVDRDGITTLDDWEDFAGYLCSQFRQSIESPAGQRMLEAVMSLWCGILGPIDGDDRQLTRDQFIAHYGCGADTWLVGIIHRYVDAIFALCDKDGDGRLSARELAGVLRVHGVSEHDLPQVMRNLVEQADGEMSKLRCTTMVLNFLPRTDAVTDAQSLSG